MKKISFLFLVFVSVNNFPQVKYPFKSFSDFKNQLHSVCNIVDEFTRTKSVNELFDTLRIHQKIPFAFGDSVAFLYRGSAASVIWAGDFNGWNPSVGSFNGTRIGLSNVWMCEKSFPAKARLDYKIVVGANWIVDPENPIVQYSGVGTTNSVLKMPEWKYPEETIYRSQINHGVLSDNFSISSTNLSYIVYYKVYLPYGYNELKNLPVIYVTDGQEYSDENLGSMINVLDNLIYDKKIKPVIAVFIDPRSFPNSSGVNRRGDEYTINKKYADFVADELVSQIDSKYKTNSSPDARAIMGTSLGGLNSAYFGAYRYDKFHLIGIHSPAFQVKTQIYDMYDKAEKLPLKVFMSTGTIFDTQSNALKLKSILDSKSYPLMYIEVPEGHSWGNWRSLLDEPLIYFFQPEIQTGVMKKEKLPDEIEIGNYPNPFNPETIIWFSTLKPEYITIRIYNSIGQQIDTVFSNKYFFEGRHSFSYNASKFTSGVYFCNLSSTTTNRIKKMVVVK